MIVQKPLTALVAACSSSKISPPALFGAEILSVLTDIVSNFTQTVPYQVSFHHPTISVQNATFCNVTVSYTHPGQNDLINVEIWLPVDDWNGRLQAVGGGGWQAGRFYFSYMLMAAAIGEGYATVSTDAGLGDSMLPENWALLSPGNVNLYALQNLGSVSLNDEAIIAKSVINDFYSKPPLYSYWSGCSQGGRQGLMLAQRYPDAYDGIVASAPAIYAAELFTSFYWPQLIMNELGQYPRPCEMAYLAKAAVSSCDAIDGVLDGVISNMDACSFDPFTVVGDTFECVELGRELQISPGAAVVASAAWTGPQDSHGNSLWYGIGYGSEFTGAYGSPGVADTNCTSATCVGQPSEMVTQWFQLFLEKNPSYDVHSMTRKDFDRFFHSAVSEYTSAIGTNDPDLSAFRDAGGKLLTFHGLADHLISFRGTDEYYDSVAALSPEVDDFYRHFQIPGLGHCFGGNGASPTTSFEQLRAWVENGTKPDTLPISFHDDKGEEFSRPLCPYPQKARFKGGDPTLAESFSCEI
ncbi:Fc.00g091660.m01.CDS01 [Cosmosporella sp. VM-42]